MRASTGWSMRCPTRRRARRGPSSTCRAIPASTTAWKSRAGCWRRNARSCSARSSAPGAGSDRRGGRAAEGARLESVYTATYRGFESHPLRQITQELSRFEQVTKSCAGSCCRGLILFQRPGDGLGQGALPAAADQLGGGKAVAGRRLLHRGFQRRMGDHLGVAAASRRAVIRSLENMHRTTDGGPHRIDGAAALLVERAEVAARRILDAELLEALPLRAFGLGAAASLQNLGDLAGQGAGALPPARHSLAKPRQ